MCSLNTQKIAVRKKINDIKTSTLLSCAFKHKEEDSDVTMLIYIFSSLDAMLYFYLYHKLFSLRNSISEDCQPKALLCRPFIQLIVQFTYIPFKVCLNNSNSNTSKFFEVLTLLRYLSIKSTGY